MTPVLFVSGCGKPSETQRDNRRLMDAILTAVVIRSDKELAKDKELLDSRRKDGKLSQSNYETLNQLIGQAEKGEWASAEKGLYEIRTQVPFPK